MYSYSHKPVFILFLFLISCHLRTDADKKFSEFYPSLPLINLPVQIVCGWPEPSLPYYTDIFDGLRYPEIQSDLNHRMDSALIVQHHMGSVVYGRLFERKPFVTLLCGQDGAEFGELSIQTFSLTGTKIDSLYVGGGCGGNDEMWSKESAAIGIDQAIIMIDTTYKWADAKRRAFDPDTTIVNTLRYQLMESGKFNCAEKKRHVVKP